MSTLPPPSPAEEAFNPYAAPKAEIGSDFAVEMQSDDEAIRKKYLNHEASVRAIGALNYLGGVVWVTAGLFLTGWSVLLMSGVLPRGADSPEKWLYGAMGVGLLALGVLVFLLGRGLRRFRPWARWSEVALASIGALANVAQLNPFGLLFPVYFLYVMLSKKGTMVFSPEYQAVRARTPHIKYKTSLIVKIAVVLLLTVLCLAIVGGITAVLFQAPGR